MSKDIRAMIQEEDNHQELAFENQTIENLNFDQMDLSSINFSGSTFVDCSFEGTNLSYCDLTDTWMPDTNFRGAKFYKAQMQRANFRNADFTNADFSGANLYACLLEDAILEGVTSDDDTQYFRLYCPPEGAFIAYKKCIGDRLVLLYIPEDSRRTSATMSCCRAEKAFVISIRSFDGTKEYNEAQSTVDENFYYVKGETVVAENFNPDRWYDSTGGIHFWMTKEEAMNY